MATDRTGRIDRMTAAVVIATAAATSFLLIMGFADPARLLPGAASPAVRTLTYYQSVRTVVLVGAAVWLLARGQARPLRLVLILNAITQSGDAVVGLADRHSAPAALGPACFAAALAYAAWRLGRTTPPSTRTPGRRPDPRRRALLMGAPQIKRARTQ
jgi:lysylphosphatidylglycerol synthetase-like protein (DUF2156 family)